MTQLEQQPSIPTPVRADHSRFTETLERLGRAFFGFGLAGLGVQCLITALPVPGLEPLPAWLPGARWWAYLSGVALVAGGVAAAVDRRVPRWTATALGTLLVGWVLLLQLPELLAHPRNGSAWTTTFEAAALSGAAWALTRDPADPGGASWRGLALVGRGAFGVALLVFGGLHLIYHDVVATLVPAWIPARPFWASFTGLAFLAAGLSLLSGVGARLGATCVGAMFGSWVLIVHAPRVLHSPANRQEWASLLIALAMCGGSWVIGARMPSLIGRARDARIHFRRRSGGGALPRPSAHAPASSTHAHE